MTVKKQQLKLTSSWLQTPLGRMIVLADEKELYFLVFADRSGLKHEIEKFRQRLNALILPGTNQLITLIQAELDQYFQGLLKKFTTPLHLEGSPFQIRVWQELQKIPFGKTLSYGVLATAIGKSSAFRAVAQANGANHFAVVIPCHRVINTSGDLGGYNGGIERKQWLLNHEKNKILI